MTKRSTKASKPESTIGKNEAPVDGVRPEQILKTAEPESELHVNGIPVSALPPQVQNLITFDLTDEGLEKKNAARVDSKGQPHSGVKVTLNGGFDKQVLQRAEATEPWETADPLLDATNKHREPGFRYHGLGPAVCEKRGMRGWETVIDRATGDPVKVGRLVLGRMPIERAEKRNKRFRDEGNENAAAAAGRFKEDHERAAHDSNSQGVRVLRAGEVMTDSADPTRQISIGVHSQRGERADVAA